MGSGFSIESTMHNDSPTGLLFLTQQFIDFKLQGPRCGAISTTFTIDSTTDNENGYEYRIFQFDEKDYEKMAWGERRGGAVNSPLVMTGLVFAGANSPGTPGRGIVTGEQLIDLDLGGLELAVLSACETGLGDVAGGQGTFGLQRAFHYAGTTNVVCSLWKVPDESTAALMGLFYRNLWTQNLSPLESLRLAQLEIYKNPGKIGELAKGFRGKFEEVSGNGDLEIKPNQDGTAHPLLWAAFTLSGPGR
jgi:hypothetical protein